MSDPYLSQKGPFKKDLEPGTYAWCACGYSKNQPFCDGSHRGHGFQPVIVKIEAKKSAAFCGCKKTGHPPFCDGTHNKL